MKSETFNRLDTSTDHEVGPGVLFSFIPDDVLDFASDGWSPDLMYLAGRSAHDFGSWVEPLIPFEFDGLSAYSGVDDDGRTFMVIEVNEASLNGGNSFSAIH